MTATEECDRQFELQLCFCSLSLLSATLNSLIAPYEWHLCVLVLIAYHATIVWHVKFAAQLHPFHALHHCNHIEADVRASVTHALA